MKTKILYIVNFLIVASLFSQAASADGAPWLTSSIDEPLYLTICGAALLFFGTMKSRSSN